MKFQVNIQTDQVQVNESITGENESDIWKQARKELERRAPFLVRAAIKLMSDQSLWSRITGYINEKHNLHEPVPNTAEEFMALGIRTGYITRLD
ncbi:hypothetical protein [Deinococcus roseus]|nr:hypothetical protein [Deinococcus roseus]